MKICTRCKMELPLGDFSKDRTRPDGLSKWCKSCVSDNSKRNYERNREKILTKQAERRKNNPELVRAQARASAAKNRDGKNAYNRERYWKNRETILERSKAHHRIKRYGITPDQFDTILAGQDSACAICGTKSEVWHVDHDHGCCPGTYTCGECVRGILCPNCNIGLGNFKDDPELLQNALIYLLSAAEMRLRT